MSLILLYLEFFKMGIFAVGGGLAILPFLFFMANDHFTFIQQAGWLSTEQVGNFLAIAQCSPGAIGVNIAAQTGFIYGNSAASGIAGSITGSIIAALGLVSPAIIVVSLVTRVLKTIRENKTAVAVFSGLRPAAAGLLCAVGFGVWKLALYDPDGAVWHKIIRWRECLVCAVIFVLMVKFKSHPIIYIVLGAAAGLLLHL